MIIDGLPPGIKYSQWLDFTPALTLALKGTVELLERLHYPQRLLIEGTHDVLWAEIDGTPASCIVFQAHGEGPAKRLWIWLSYTAPEHRRKGLHQKLFAILERIAVLKEAVTIEGSAMLSNTPMYYAATKCGREAQFLTFVKKVKGD